MADTPLSAAAHASRRRREDAVLAEAETILLGRMRRRGRLRNPREAERFLRMRLAGLRHEELHAVWLDGRHRIIACDVLAKGTIDRAAIDARVVAQLALQHNACALILAHNHPSGVAVPSADDIMFTARLSAALALFDVSLLEHFVVGEGAAASVRPATRSGGRTGVPGNG